MSTASSDRMSPLEIRASLSLASIFALRMLGLFLILPVFAVYATHLQGGDNHTLVGIALGTYGLTQGMLQIPYGMASDRYGRKRVIIIGLVLFAIGSFIAAMGGSIHVIIVGRAIQGAGAISAPVMAFLADLTREQHRTKAMALVAIWVVVSVVPQESLVNIEGADHIEKARFGDVLRSPDLLRLNLGIFSLHAVQMAIFVVVPLAMVSAGGLPVDEHWKVYLPVVLGSFVLMVPAIFYAEKNDALKPVFLACIGLMAAVQLGFVFALHNFTALVILLLGFFVAFNILEASLPSLVSRTAPGRAKGAALGVYNTTQSLGLFFGGAAGGWLMQHHGRAPVFMFGTALIALWGIAAAGMRVPQRVRPRGADAAGGAALGDQAAR